MLKVVALTQHDRGQFEKPPRIRIASVRRAPKIFRVSDGSQARVAETSEGDDDAL
jgi:hypothetical protein